MFGESRPSEKNLQNFILQVSKLEAIEFLGLLKIFNIDIVNNDEEKTPKKFEELLSEVIDKYIMLSRTQRRNIMKIIKLSNLGKIEV